MADKSEMNSKLAERLWAEAVAEGGDKIMMGEQEKAAQAQDNIDGSEGDYDIAN